VTIVYADAAKADLAEIWVYNAERYDVARADEYLQFLRSAFARLSEDPVLGRPVAAIQGVHRLVAKRRPSGHGHVAYYRIEPDCIVILRILHTSMHAIDHLSG